MWLTFRATFIRNFITMKRAYPWSFFVGHILTGVYLTLFAFLTYHYVFDQSMDGQFQSYAETGDYLSYVISGALLYTFSVSLLMIVSRALITELREGTLEALLLTPSSRKGYFLGYLSQGFMRMGIEFIAMLLLGALFGLTFSNVNLLATGTVLAVFITCLFSQALVLGGFMLQFRDTYLTQNTLFILMGLVCSITFPIEYLPQSVQWIGLIMPLTHGIDAFRDVFVEGAGIIAVRESIYWLIGLTIIYFPVGSLFLQRMERTVLEKHFG
ncbi:ABC transporter permease [Alkalihalobacillus sp. AL-G]|uniref:ABC transporter permease n=1 Tax=Alkalihalobacillus sp. AL-G TaxID=2926399 RepID=UPI00272A76E6|nr:ABC transporter permease [Alkalihalobacillus sp. AL-G]WLD94661.1 ABC transporter permease [Alkalihalobacillus sp. AL-G]